MEGPTIASLIDEVGLIHPKANRTKKWSLQVRSGSPAMPAVRRLRQEDSQESEVNLGYRETLSRNKQPRFLTEFGNKG